MFGANSVYDTVCREVCHGSGSVTTTAEASASTQQHQLSQCTVAVTGITHHRCHSLQSLQSGSLLKTDSLPQSSSMVIASLPSSLPSSVSRQADRTADLLTQLQQLVESCRLPSQASSDLMSWFSHELLNMPHTHGPPSQQVWAQADTVHMSSSVHGGNSGTSEVRTLETFSTLNNSDALPAGSVVAAQMPWTVCSQENFHGNAAAVSTERTVAQLPTDCQYATAEMQPPSAGDFVDRQSVLTHLQRLQQVHLDSAASALQRLYVLEQQASPGTSTTVDPASTVSTTSTATGSLEDAVECRWPVL